MAKDIHMNGGCHHFAVAMHRLTGWDLAAVVGPHRGEMSVYHVFCLDPEGEAWDARGSHDPSDLTDEQEAMDGSETWIVPLGSEASVWLMSRGGEKALLNPIHESFVLDALDDVTEVIGEDVPQVSDGWAPHDRKAVEAACRGEGELPSLERPVASRGLAR